MKNLILVFIIVFVSSLSIYSQKQETIFSPKVLEESQTELGYSLINKVLLVYNNGIQLNSTIKEKVLAFTYTIQPTKLYFLNDERDYIRYICPDKCIKIDRNNGKPSLEVETDYGGIRVSKKGDVFRIYRSTADEKLFFDFNINKLIYSPYYNVAKLETIPIIQNVELKMVQKSNFQKEFIYNGKVGNSIKFIYREFMEDMARPSFTQEVQYDLEESKIVGFKGMKIEILNATNSLIKYKVISHFPEN